MTKLMFVCLGNICRSPMAEFFMKELVKQRGCAEQFQIASAATCSAQLGNPVYPPVQKLLDKHGISYKENFPFSFKKAPPSCINAGSLY